MSIQHMGDPGANVTGNDISPDEGDSAQQPVGIKLSRGDLQDRAIQGAIWTLIHTLVSLPLAFLVNILLARVLGVVDYGRLAYLTTVLALVGSIVSMGVGTGIMQFGAKAHASGRTREVQRILSATLGFRLIVTLPVMTVAVLAISDIAPWLTVLALVFGVFVPAYFGGAPACFGIESKTAQGAQNAMLVNLLTQVAVVLTLLLIPSSDAVWAVRLAMGGVGVMLALLYVSPVYRRAVLVPSLPRGLPVGFWKFALPAGAAGLVGSLVASRSEVMVLTWMSAVQAAGIFALAFGLANHLFGPAQALLGPLVPAVAGLREVDEEAVGRALLRTMRASATIVGLMLAAAVPPFAHLVVPIYGSEYGEVPDVLLALGVVGAVNVVASPVRAFVQARLSGVRLLVINLLAVAVGLAVMLPLIPSMGVWGAVAGALSSALLQLLALLGGERRALGLTWGSVAFTIMPLLLGAGAAGGGWFSTLALGLHAIPAALVAGLVGAALVVGGVRLLRTGLSIDDAEAILRALPQRLRRLARPVMFLAVGVREGRR